MSSYRVEEIEDDVLQATHQVEALTPFEAAAARVANRAVTLWNSQAKCLRVTLIDFPKGRNEGPPTVYEYRDRPSAAIARAIQVLTRDDVADHVIVGVFIG